mgnify:CR=1 FL=1
MLKNTKTIQKFEELQNKQVCTIMLMYTRQYFVNQNKSLFNVPKKVRKVQHYIKKGDKNNGEIFH